MRRGGGGEGGSGWEAHNGKTRHQRYQMCCEPVEKPDTDTDTSIDIDTDISIDLDTGIDIDIDIDTTLDIDVVGCLA